MTSTSRRVFSSATALLLIAGAGLVWFWSFTPVAPAPRTLTSQEEARDLTDRPGRDVLEAAAARTQDAQRAALRRTTAPSPESALAPRHAPETLNAMVEALVDLIAAQGLYNAAKLREGIVVDVLRSPAKLAVFEDTLRDEAFARATFGSRQAEARYFASQTLQRAAREGNQEPLFRAASAIAAEATAGALSRGRQQDLEELVLGWARGQDEATLERLPPSVLQQMGYCNELPDEVRELYRESLFLALYPRTGKKRARIAVKRLFDT